MKLYWRLQTDGHTQPRRASGSCTPDIMVAEAFERIEAQEHQIHSLRCAEMHKTKFLDSYLLLVFVLQKVHWLTFAVLKKEGILVVVQNISPYDYALSDR
jgi:hypothetical protein